MLTILKTLAGALAAPLLMLMLMLSLPADASAQEWNPPIYNEQQLDQLAAPIALYPDPLVAQILMASTYPAEIVEASRWLANGGNTLQGGQLAEALGQQPWDPSVKSLAPFPQVLSMLDSNLEWTEQLGDAFLSQQDAVMNAIQALRHQALSVGALVSTPQQAVAEQGPYITISPVNPYTVYVPYYDPAQVYGAWPYPAYPPYTFPPPPGYAAYGDMPLVFGAGVVILAPFWGWDHWDWRHHRIDIDDNRFRGINHDRPPVAQGVWQHDPAHRHGVPYHEAGARARFLGDRAAPKARHDFRGFSAQPDEIRPGKPVPEKPVLQADTLSHPGSFGVYKPNAHILEHPAPKPAPVIVTRGPGSNSYGAAPEPYHASPADAFNHEHTAAPALESYAHGPEVRAEAARGAASRQMAHQQAVNHPAPQQHGPVHGEEHEHHS